jgi:hypothetical protein
MGAHESGKMFITPDYTGICVSLPRCQNRLTTCNEVNGLTECPLCHEAFPRMEKEQSNPVQGSSSRVTCVNMHLVGEQWIEMS